MSEMTRFRRVIRRFFLPMPPSRRPVRFVTLGIGLILFGLSVSLMVRADLGLDPWNVLHAGLSRQTGLTLGQATIVVGAVIVALWVPLRVRIGVGSLINVVVVGLAADFFLWAIPVVDDLALRWAILVLAVLSAAVGCGIYIGAGLGAGPRDGLMLGLRDRGVGAIWLVRTSMEIMALGIGWLLGGKVGLGTLIYAVSFGPLLHVVLPLVSLEPRRGER